MKLRRTISLLATIVFASLISTCWSRTWTDRKGRTIEADLISSKEGVVRIKRKDGKLFNLKMEQISDEDQEYVKTASEEQTDSQGDIAQPNQSDWLVEAATARQIEHYGIRTNPTVTLKATKGLTLYEVTWRLTAVVGDATAAESHAKANNYVKTPEGTYRNIYNNEEIRLDGEYRIFDMNEVLMIDQSEKEFQAVWVDTPTAESSITPEGLGIGIREPLENWRLTVQSYAGKNPTNRFIGLLEAKKPTTVVAIFAATKLNKSNRAQLQIRGGQEVPIKVRKSEPSRPR